MIGNQSLRLPVVSIEDIPDPGSKGVSTEPLSPVASLLIVKHDSRVFVYRNRCPHLGTELEWLPDQFLDRDKQYIQCATHGALFRINTGECIAGPCVGERLQAVEYEFQEKCIMIKYHPVIETL